MSDMNVFEYNDYYGGTYRVIPKLNTYAENNNLYIGLDYFDTDCNAWLPYSDITVNVGRLPFLESAIDTNNNGNEVVDFLVRNGFGELTGDSIPSGFCVFPVFKFNEDKLKEIDSFTFKQYAKAHNKKSRSLEDAIQEAKEKSATKAFEEHKKSKVLDEAR